MGYKNTDILGNAHCYNQHLLNFKTFMPFDPEILLLGICHHKHGHKTMPYVHISILRNNHNPSCFPPKKPGNNLNAHQSLKGN